MAISYVGSCSGTNEPTGLPAHAAGDMLVVFAFRNDGTLPGLAGGAGYTTLATGGSGSFLWRIGYKRATSNSESGGVWSGAVLTVLSIFKDVGALLTPQTNEGAGTSDFLFGSGFSLSSGDGKSWVVACLGARDNDVGVAAPTGMTLRGTRSNPDGSVRMYSTPSAVSTFGDTSAVQSGDGSPWRSAMFEMRPGTGMGLSATESATTISSTGYTELQATTNSALLGHSIATTSIFDVVGNLSYTESSTSLSSTAQLEILGNLSTTLPSHTVTASSSMGIDANLSYTEGNTSLSAQGALERYANLTSTLSDHTVVSDSYFGLEATLSYTLNSQTISSSASLFGMEGSLSFTEGGTTLSSTGSTEPVGSMSYSLQSDTVASTSIFGITGSVSFTESETTIDSTGQLGAVVNLSVSLPSHVVASISYMGIEANVSFTESDTALSSTGAFGISGDFAFTEGPTTLASTGGLDRTGNVSFTEGETSLSFTVGLDSVGLFAFIESPTTLYATIQKENIGLLSFSEDDTSLVSSGNLPINAEFAFTEDDTVVTHFPKTYPPECCVPPICQLTEESLVCDFINLLPKGPMWDTAKIRAFETYKLRQSSSEYTYNQKGCSTFVTHAIYTATRLHYSLQSSLWPALRESDPFTAYDSIDDWLDRMGWIDCFACAFPYPGECEVTYCDVEIPEPLRISIKHAILVALTRLDMGILARVDEINWVLEPLGAKLIPKNDGVCPLKFEIIPYSDTIGEWTELTCLGQPLTAIQSWFDPNGCYDRGLPHKVFPGLVAAECIAKSVLSRDPSIQVKINPC